MLTFLWLSESARYLIGDSYSVTLPSSRRVGKIVAHKPGAILVRYMQ